MMSKRVLVTFAAVLLILSMVNFVSAITGKIGNARAVLYPEVGLFGTTIDRTVLVKNENDVPVNIRLEADINSSFIEIVDKEFTLEPWDEKDARFKIKIKKAGDYEGRVNIFFSPADGNGAGVVLSSTIIIHAGREGSDSGDDDSSSDGSDTDSDSSDTDSGMSGDVIKMQNFVSDNKAIVVVSVSTLVLSVLLIVLLYISKKRRGKEGKLKAKRVNDRKV